MTSRSAPFNPGQSLNDALAHHRAGRLHEAEKIYGRVLKALPDNFDALNLLGTVKAQLGHMGEAQRLLSAAVKVNPRSPEAWIHLGDVLYALKRPQETLDCFDKARALAPNNDEFLFRHANALLSVNRPDEALVEFQSFLSRAPRHVEARIGCGLAQAALGQADLALAEFDAALAAAPGHPLVQFNRGVALLTLGRYADALAANERALAVIPEHLGALLNRGRALAQLNRLDEAVASYDRIIAARKDHADAHFNAALALLTRGDYRRGFDEYEWRWRRTGMAPQKSRGKPLWRGEYPLYRKTILLHAEQGLGDTIQFARYVPPIAATGAKVVLEVQPALKALMARLDGASSVIAPDEAAPAFDVHCPLGTLPLALHTEPAAVPAQIPYLSADEACIAQWAPRLDGLKKPKVALVWAGNPDHHNDRNRSIAFATLTPLLSAPASFVSLQRDLREEDAVAVAAESRITQIGDALADFSDTAAVLALCDLVITVDTAVAHLAGAMGRPLWVLVPFAPDWRWTLRGETTPWYPNARLFRQSATGDWDDVIARVAAALAQFARA